MATGLPRRSRNVDGCGHSCGRLPRRGQPNDEHDENLTYAGGAQAWTSASPPDQLTCPSGETAWASASSREAAARQREPRDGLSARRREQNLVATAEEGTRHDFERLCKRLPVATPGGRSLAMQRNFRGRLECRSRAD